MHRLHTPTRSQTHSLVYKVPLHVHSCCRAGWQLCKAVSRSQKIHKAGFFPACAKAELLSGKRLSFRFARLTSLQTSRKDARLSPGLFADRGFATAFALAATLLPI